MPMTIFNARYRIPRKRKYTVIVYNKHVFQTETDFKEYLTSEVNFSENVADTIISNINFIDKDEMTNLLSSLKLKSTIIQKYMTGVIVK